MNNKMIAHVWANNVDAKKKGSNFYCEDGNIFSYGRHFLIAKHIRVDGNPAIVITNRRYSPSTSRHVSYVRQAIPSNIPLYTIVEISTIKVDYTADEIDTLELARKRKEQDDVTYAAKEKARRAKERREENKRKRDGYKLEIASWRANLTAVAPWHAIPVMLRISADGTLVQTSRGAYVPVAIAKRAWTRLQDAFIAKTGLDAPDFAWGNFRGMKLYCVDSPAGLPWYLKVGCHDIPFHEVQDIARALGLVVLPPAAIGA